MTLREWAKMAGVEMPNISSEGADKDAMRAALEQVERKVNEKMEKEMFCRFIELYRDDEIPVDPNHPRRKTPLYISQSIRIERERMLLPVVTVERLYALMEADQSGDKPTDNKPKLVQNVTPTFFEWGGRMIADSEIPLANTPFAANTSSLWIRMLRDKIVLRRFVEILPASGGLLFLKM